MTSRSFNCAGVVGPRRLRGGEVAASAGGLAGCPRGLASASTTPSRAEERDESSHQHADDAEPEARDDDWTPVPGRAVVVAALDRLQRVLHHHRALVVDHRLSAVEGRAIRALEGAGMPPVQQQGRAQMEDLAQLEAAEDHTRPAPTRRWKTGLPLPLEAFDCGQLHALQCYAEVSRRHGICVSIVRRAGVLHDARGCYLPAPQWETF